MNAQDEFCYRMYEGAFHGARTVLRGKDHRGISESDIAQQVVMEYLQRPRPVRSPFSFGYTCGRNRALDALRNNARVKEVSTTTSPIEETLYSKECSPERKLFADELIESIRETVCEKDWFIIHSRSEEMTYDEIGSLLGMSSSTVRFTYDRACNRLKEAFGDEYQDA